MLHPQPAGLAAVLTALPAWLFSEDAASRALHEVVRAVLSVIVSQPIESQGRGSLVGCRLWGSKESDTTEATWFSYPLVLCRPLLLLPLIFPSISLF